MKFPAWDEIGDGWQANFTTPDQAITPETFGVIHGDAHTGNFMLDDLGNGEYMQTTIDFDNSQRSWYIIDIGTVTWVANMQFHNYSPYLVEPWTQETYEEAFGNFKTWLLDEYGWGTTPELLTQACEFRRDFMYTLAKIVIWFTWGEARAPLKQYIEWNEQGLIASC